MEWRFLFEVKKKVHPYVKRKKMKFLYTLDEGLCICISYLVKTKVWMHIMISEVALANKSIGLIQLCCPLAWSYLNWRIGYIDNQEGINYSREWFLNSVVNYSLNMNSCCKKKLAELSNVCCGDWINSCHYLISYIYDLQFLILWILMVFEV